MLKSKIYDFSNSFTAKQQNYLCRLAFHVNGLFIDGLNNASDHISNTSFFVQIRNCVPLSGIELEVSNEMRMENGRLLKWV